MAQYAPIDPTQVDDAARVYGGDRENLRENPDEMAKKKKMMADMLSQMGQQFGQQQEDAPMQQLQGIVQQQRPFEPPPQAMSRPISLMPSRRNVMGF